MSVTSIDFLLVYCVTLFPQGATFLFLQAAAMTECLIKFRAGKRILSRMDSLMSLQVAISDECLVTYRAGKRLLSSMGSLMSLQVAISHAVFTHLTTKWILSCSFKVLL